jgi:GMP synthase (glutamine-hydrolysing)
VRLLSGQHPKARGPGTFGRAVAEAGVTYDEWCPAHGEPLPADPTGYDGIVVLGGEQNVVDAPRLPYLRDEVALIRAALERRQPVLGVCLGAQLLVAAVGGEVVGVSEPEIGWHEVRLLPQASSPPADMGPAFGAGLAHAARPCSRMRYASTRGCDNSAPVARSSALDRRLYARVLLVRGARSPLSPPRLA